MSYNNWIRLQLNRIDMKKASITIARHAIRKAEYEDISYAQIQDAVRTGRIITYKCEWPNKLCFKKYFGKDNRSCIAIVLFKAWRIEVKTVWQTTGN